ncbi:MAG: stage III sporulation protein AD [Dorea sp.]|uniref:stage III sporulation protein AD n=1 Tax=Sporofaciens musculi TaxID=2681861 RepID=UPI002172178A|nr:stage III sporulation protein AD [Sporofaciens musculi]MCI9422772.1 stage III sporulation protein AD [Dorea sp.]
MDMLRIGIMGVAGTLLAIQFKSGKSEYGIYITVVLSLIIFFSVLGHIGTIVETMKGIGRFIQMDQAYIGTLIKMLGITYIAEFSSGICKDAGYQTIASQIEIFGKLAVMLLSLPILMTLLNTIREFLS